MTGDSSSWNKHRAINLLFQGAGMFLATVFFFSSVYLIYRYTLGSMTTLAWDSYDFSELLINYSGGFVRRGLLGTVILAFSGGRSALPVTNTLLFGDYVLLLLSMIFLALRSGRLRTWNAALVLVMPGGLLPMVVSNEFFPRKEMIFYSSLAVCAIAVSFLQAMKHQTARRFAAYYVIGILGLLGLLLSLVHETFIFLAAPANLFLLIAAIRETKASTPGHRSTKGMERGVAYAYIGIVFVVFLSMAHFRGGKAVAEQMWSSVNATDRLMMSTNGTVRGGISTMEQGADQLLTHPLHVVVSGLAWYWLMPLFGLMMYCLTLVALNIGEKPEGQSRELYPWVVCYLTLAVCAAPTFLLGADWGRWIRAINFCFLLLWFSVAPHNLAEIAMNRFTVRMIGRSRLECWSRRVRDISCRYASFVVRNKLAAVATMLFFAMTLRLPEWRFNDRSYYIWASGVHAIKHIIHLSSIALR
jgi:hypothetical protein